MEKLIGGILGFLLVVAIIVGVIYLYFYCGFWIVGHLGPDILDPLVKSPAGLGLNGRTPNFAQASHGGSSIFEEVLVRGGVFTRASSLIPS